MGVGLKYEKLEEERNILPSSDFASASVVSVTSFDL